MNEVEYFREMATSFLIARSDSDEAISKNALPPRLLHFVRNDRQEKIN